MVAEKVILEKLKLETGDIVVLNNGSKYLVIGDKLVSDTGFLHLHKYNDSLQFVSEFDSPNYDITEFDVKEVHEIVSGWGCGLTYLLEGTTKRLVWKRDSQIDMEVNDYV